MEDNIKTNLKETGFEDMEGINSSGSRYRQAASPRGHGSEHKRSIKHNEFLYHVKNYQHLKKDNQNIAHISNKVLGCLHT